MSHQSQTCRRLSSPNKSQLNSHITIRSSIAVSALNLRNFALQNHSFTVRTTSQIELSRTTGLGRNQSCDRSSKGFIVDLACCRNTNCEYLRPSILECKLGGMKRCSQVKVDCIQIHKTEKEVKCREKCAVREGFLSSRTFPTSSPGPQILCNSGDLIFFWIKLRPRSKCRVQFIKRCTSKRKETKFKVERCWTGSVRIVSDSQQWFCQWLFWIGCPILLAAKSDWAMMRSKSV